MVIRISNRATRRQSGLLTTDLIVAMAILVIALLPLSGSFVSDRKLLRVYYYRSVAMELVDGELESLAAAGGGALPEGAREFQPRGLAATNLPPGKFILTRQDRHLKLEWQPARKDCGGRIVRERTLP